MICPTWRTYTSPDFSLFQKTFIQTKNHIQHHTDVKVKRRYFRVSRSSLCILESYPTRKKDSAALTLFSLKETWEGKQGLCFSLTSEHFRKEVTEKQMTFKSHIKIDETKCIHVSISPSCSQLCEKTLVKTTAFITPRHLEKRTKPVLWPKCPELAGARIPPTAPFWGFTLVSTIAGGFIFRS